MIREEKIKELMKDKVIAQFDQALNQYGFKYFRSKKQFILQEQAFRQVIAIDTPKKPLVYNDDTEQIHLVFYISSHIEMPTYDEWYFEKLGERKHFSIRLEKFTAQIELSFYDFEKESFFQPTARQHFKQTVSDSLIDGLDPQKDIVCLEDFLQSNIDSIVAKLKENSNILHLYKHSNSLFQHIYLLLFGGYDELANAEWQKYYDFLVSEIEAQRKLSENSMEFYIKMLNKLIVDCQKLSGLTFYNPHGRSMRIAESKNDSFEFSGKTKFFEVLRLNISKFELNSVNVNAIGDILLFTTNQKIVKLNSKGEPVFEKDIVSRKGFDMLSWGVPTGVLQCTNDFFVHNFIITSSNQLIELPLPIQKLKKGKLQNPHISDLAFCTKSRKYLMIYEDQLITFTLDGQVEKTVNLGQKYKHKLLLEKGWVVTQVKDKKNVISDFDGNTIATYEFGNGNHRYEFSANYDHLLCFFYSTKSQLYDLTTGKQKTLWAHPTFVKDYKEVLYNDVEHNFGMNIAKFSPDNKYIVGGAWHGKYVAWMLPKLDRIELMPSDEMIGHLGPVKVDYTSVDGNGVKVTEVEKVVLGNQTFLKNRTNGISKIIFFEGGDVFITELGYGRFVLSWDRNFNNLSYKKINGKLEYHAGKYLTQKGDEELIVFEQKQ